MSTLGSSSGTFGQISSQLRSIAADLGGYITAGETYLQEIDDVDYTVGWLTMRIPEDRFDDALNRVDGLGERLSLNVSSQDVTEEYVDLEGRLRYWRSQEEFYQRLMNEATEIDDLVTIQTRMQDVLLNIEQIEGRLRYLDSRTSFSTLTVGLTEVPGIDADRRPGRSGHPRRGDRSGRRGAARDDRWTHRRCRVRAPDRPAGAGRVRSLACRCGGPSSEGRKPQASGQPSPEDEPSAEPVANDEPSEE